MCLSGAYIDYSKDNVSEWSIYWLDYSKDNVSEWSIYWLDYSKDTCLSVSIVRSGAYTG